MTTKTTGIALATATAAIFAMGALATAPVYAAEGGVHCVGANACKGTSECKSAKNDCKGMNACKAQGGCKSGDNGCAGKNSCKGKGGCAVPVQH